MQEILLLSESHLLSPISSISVSLKETGILKKIRSIIGMDNTRQIGMRVCRKNNGKRSKCYSTARSVIDSKIIKII